MSISKSYITSLLEIDSKQTEEIEKFLLKLAKTGSSHYSEYEKQKLEDIEDKDKKK